MSAVRRFVAGMAPALLVAAGITAGAHASIVRNADGSFSAPVGDQVVVIPADLAAQVAGALEENGDDPAALLSAFQALVAGHAGGAEDLPLALAIAAFAISSVRDDPRAVTAIINATVGGNPSATPQGVLRTASQATPSAPDPRPRSGGVGDTVEDPAQTVSPV